MGKKLFDYIIGNPPYQQESKDTALYNFYAA
ncbi:Eco57I restriction-modification methylase domain-containing protein [Megasphaera elsdenii]